MRTLLVMLLMFSTSAAWANPQCDTLVDDLNAYNSDTRLNEYAITDYLSTQSGEVLQQYNNLKGYEGKSSVIPADTFAPLKEMSKKLADSSQMISDNSAYLEGRFQDLISRVSQCLK